MLLRLLASISLAVLLLLGLSFCVARVFNGVTLYSTRYDLAGNAGSVAAVVILLLAAVLTGVFYFKRCSLRGLWFQPYLNVAILLYAGLLLSASVSEFAPGKAEPLDTVTIVVLPETFTVAGEEGTNVVTLVNDEFDRYSAKKPQLLLLADGNIDSRRVQGTLQALKDAGYQNIGLVSNSSD